MNISKKFMIVTVLGLAVCGQAYGMFKNEKSSQDKYGNTELHRAVKNNDEKAVKKLLKDGADINQVNNAGESPLHIAASKNYLEIVEILLAKGAEVNREDGFENSPMDYALVHKNTKMITVLAKAQQDAKQRKN